MNYSLLCKYLFIDEFIKNVEFHAWNNTISLTG